MPKRAPMHAGQGSYYPPKLSGNAPRMALPKVGSDDIPGDRKRLARPEGTSTFSVGIQPRWVLFRRAKAGSAWSIYWGTDGSGLLLHLDLFRALSRFPFIGDIRRIFLITSTSS